MAHPLAWRKPKYTPVCLRITWPWAILFLSSAFACNLRAYLITVHYEPEINTEADILALNRRLFLPSGTIFAQLYGSSKLEVRKKLYAQVEERDQWFRYRSLIQLQ